MQNCLNKPNKWRKSNLIKHTIKDKSQNILVDHHIVNNTTTKLMVEQLRQIGINIRAGSRGDVKVLCPKCSHTRKHRSDPCLSVNVDKGVWNCHNCDFKGGIKQEIVYTEPPQELKKLSQSVVDWFSKRGISNQTLLRYNITEGVDYMPQSGEVRTIHFNYYYNGQLVNIKYRDAEKNFKMVAGARLVPYGWDVAMDSVTDTIIICEGEMDCLSFYEAGLPNCISVPNGASKGSQKMEWLEEVYQYLDGKKIYIATDMDEAGQSLKNEIARRLGKENCWNLELPRKDANEVITTDGLGKLVECYHSAMPFPVEGIDDAASVGDEVLSLYDGGIPKGWYAFDTEFHWHPGQVSIITGIPGHGKSTFVKNVISKLAERYGLRFFIYSAEEASTAMALTDLYSITTGQGFFESSYGPRISREKIVELQPYINEHFKFYRLSDNDLTIDGILAKGKEMVRQYGIHGMVIDNMSTVEKSLSSKSDTRHHQIQTMLSDVSKFAKNHGVHVFLVAHPKKMVEVKTGVYKVPNGYDISDSAHWYNLTDNGITVYRNFETMQTEVHLWKVRHKYSGQVGTDYFNFTPFNSRYELTEALNNGNDRTKFIGQPIDKKEIEGFSRLSDTAKGALGATKVRGANPRIPN